MIAAARGYRLKLCVPDNVTVERKRTLRAYGAELILTDPMEGTDGAIREARRRYAAEPDRYFYADQYNNDANWRAHYETTAAEILEQTDGRVTHFVAGLGTSGTFIGVGPAAARVSTRGCIWCRCSPTLRSTGSKGSSTWRRRSSGHLRSDLADEDVRVTTERAQALTRQLAVEEGLLVGVSSGAALAASLDLASRIPEGLIVTIFPDSGTRYMSERFWGRVGYERGDCLGGSRSGADDFSRRAGVDSASRRRNLPARVLRRAARIGRRRCR